MDSQTRAKKLHEGLLRYQAHASPHYDEVVLELIDRASQTGSLSKADIGGLVLWKRLNASTRWADALMRTDDAEVRAATAAARQAALDMTLGVAEAASQARKQLSRLPGFTTGDAIASSVIFVLAPDRMAVYDRRAQLGLERLGLQLTTATGRYGRYMTLVEQLAHEVAELTTISAREVDLALYILGGPTE